MYIKGLFAPALPDHVLLHGVIFPVKSITKLPLLYRIQMSSLVQQITQMQFTISVLECGHMFFCHLGKLP